MSSRFVGRLIVGFVLSLIFFIAYSSQIFIIWPWYGNELSVELIVLLLPFNLLVGMLLWNYRLSVVTDPGHVPAHWKPDTHSDGLELKKLTGTPRYCRMCENYKPPRAHHCRQCNRCVLRMDHHCPWVDNCVGHFNYGHFIRFLFFVDVACLYHFAMVTRRVFDATQRQYWDILSGTELAMIIMNYVTCIPVILAVGGFSIYHFFALLGNSTTIEGWEKDKVAIMVRQGKIREIKFPYNLGRRKNIESVLGRNPLLWCWPSITPGSGLKFELAPGNGVDTSHSWPPVDRRPVEEGRFELGSSPWTYENGSFNPDLLPSNTDIRERRRRPPGALPLPPYHPDYQEGQANNGYAYDPETDSDNEYDHSSPGKPHVRRGSEGYEVRPVDREAMLQRYLRDIGEQPGRYNHYVPEPASESESEDDKPLGVIHATGVQ